MEKNQKQIGNFKVIDKFDFEENGEGCFLMQYTPIGHKPHYLIVTFINEVEEDETIEPFDWEHGPGGYYEEPAVSVEPIKIEVCCSDWEHDDTTKVIKKISRNFDIALADNIKDYITSNLI